MKVYKRGKVIFSLNDLVKILNKGDWVFYKKRPIHSKFVMHMTLLTVIEGLKKELFAVAVKQEGLRFDS